MLANGISSSYADFYDRLLNPAFAALARLSGVDIANVFAAACNDFINLRAHGDQAQWQEALQKIQQIKLPAGVLATFDQSTVAASSAAQLSPATLTELRSALMELHPWRKGPFDLHGIHIDTEWRSDMKWSRLQPWLEPLSNRAVLDVGCGSGYHCWRARGDGARLVVGIDPSIKFMYQFAAVKSCLPPEPVYYLPMRSEDLPGSGSFDTVLSMGVLYHRRSPLEHIAELAGELRRGGQLILETLVVDGDENTVLMPEGRYSQMRNVWFLPSPEMLLRWLRRCGFSQVRLCDVSRTTSEEQRPTEWMRFQSLSDFLDPQDRDRTIEGYPAPRRAIVSATLA